MLLTIYFDGQFWAGLIECREEGRTSAIRHVFGPEPTDPQVWAFIQRDLPALLHRMTTSVASGPPRPRPANPKRLARQAAKALAAPAVSSVAQEALKAQQAAHKKVRRERSKQQREAQAEARYLQARQKAKQRHRGK